MDGTPRQQLRALIIARHSMLAVENMARHGSIASATLDRYERLWAVSTATEHRRTRSWPIEKWRARRDRACAAISALAHGKPQEWYVWGARAGMGRPGAAMVYGVQRYLRGGPPHSPSGEIDPRTYDDESAAEARCATLNASPRLPIAANLRNL